MRNVIVGNTLHHIPLHLRIQVLHHLIPQVRAVEKSKRNINQKIEEIINLKTAQNKEKDQKIRNMSLSIIQTNMMEKNLFLKLTDLIKKIQNIIQNTIKNKLKNLLIQDQIIEIILKGMNIKKIHIKTMIHEIQGIQRLLMEIIFITIENLNKNLTMFLLIVNIRK